jgi:DNA replication and repair protein RecF
MQVKKLRIHGVRNLTEVSIKPNKKINIFTGRNASGKTSFLEAIHILARSKSFRTPRIKDVINFKEKQLSVAAEIEHERLTTINLKVNKGGKNNILSLNGSSLKTVSELATILPIISINQDTQLLITGSPKQRRHWLDWAMFHVEPSYLMSWKQYFKALRHRNILLQKGETKEELYRAWEAEMVKSSVSITAQRKTFIGSISSRFNQFFGEQGGNNKSITYKQGWQEDIQYDEYLFKRRAEDQQKGYTKYGAHQADVIFTDGGEQIKKTYSRGQIKLYINQVLMSQARVIEEKGRVQPIILMDDYTAELDINNSEYLLSWLKNQEFQAFITTTEAQKNDENTTVFHVEQGKIVK